MTKRFFLFQLRCNIYIYWLLKFSQVRRYLETWSRSRRVSLEIPNAVPEYVGDRFTIVPTLSQSHLERS